MALSWTPTGEYNEDLFRQYTEMLESDSPTFTSKWFVDLDAAGQESQYWSVFEQPMSEGTFDYGWSDALGYSFTQPVLNSLITQDITTSTAPVTIETPVFESTGLLSGADYNLDNTI